MGGEVNGGVQRFLPILRGVGNIDAIGVNGSNGMPVTPQADFEGNIYVRLATLDPSGGVGVISPEGGQLNADDLVNTMGALNVRAFAYGYDGATFDRIRTQSPANIAAAVKTGVINAAPPANWTVANEALVNAQATATRAAGGVGVAHIATGLAGEFSVDVAGVPIRTILRLRDGISGAGTILWSLGMSFAGMPVGTSARVFLSGLQIPGTVNTAMTIEFSAAGGANTFESVSLQGYDVG